MSTWAVASCLGFDLAFVLACTSEHQDRALLRLGAKPVPGVAAIRVDDFLEDARLMYFDVLNPSDFARKQIAEIRETLNLNAHDAAFGVESAAA